MKYNWKVFEIAQDFSLGVSLEPACLSIWNAFMQTGSLGLHRKYSVMPFLFSWRGSLSEARPILIYCRFHPDTHMHRAFHSHTLRHILCDTFLSLFPSRSHSLCSTVMSQAASVCRRCSLIWRSGSGGDRSDRTTHAGWDRSTRAVSHETVPQALKITLKSRSKAESTESRRAVAI